jgi:hypothetical protein
MLWNYENYCDFRELDSKVWWNQSLSHILVPTVHIVVAVDQHNPAQRMDFASIAAVWHRIPQLLQDFQRQTCTHWKLWIFLPLECNMQTASSEEGFNHEFVSIQYVDYRHLLQSIVKTISVLSENDWINFVSCNHTSNANRLTNEIHAWMDKVRFDRSASVIANHLHADRNNSSNCALASANSCNLFTNMRTIISLLQQKLNPFRNYMELCTNLSMLARQQHNTQYFTIPTILSAEYP